MITNEKKRLKSIDISMLITHALFNAVSIFVTTFLISYIYEVSNNYIMDIGLFYGFMYISMLVFYHLISKLIAKTNRVIIYRIAIIVRSIFILCVIFLGKDLAKYVIMAGFLYGFSEAGYWTSYNLMKNELVSHHVMAKFAVVQLFNTKIINVVVPLILGKIIDSASFKTCSVIVLIAVMAQLIFSLFIKSKRPENSYFCFKEFWAGYKKLEKNKKTLILFALFTGLVYGMTAIVPPLNTILVMVSFESNLSLGVFSGCFAISSVVLLLVYKKWTKLGKRTFVYVICAILPIVASSLLLFEENKTTVLIRLLTYTIVEVLYVYSYDVMRNLLLKKFNMYDSIAEFQCLTEHSLQIGRILVFMPMALIGFLCSGGSAITISNVLKILSGLSMLLIAIMNIGTAVYEKKFSNVIRVED